MLCQIRRGEKAGMRKPVVALVGRPNVGKSTLFNRLLGKRVAIVEDQPGVTRDRIYGKCSWGRKEFLLVDTGGLDPLDRDRVRRLAQEHTAKAIEEADLLLFLVDAADGLHPLDLDLALLVRQSGKPSLLVACKVDEQRREMNLADFFELGMGEPFPTSALHGVNIGDLLDLVCASLPPACEEEEEETIPVAIVGRQNVGKSTLLNALLGEERCIVDESPGTTRDVVDAIFPYEGKKLLIIDTAGIRRKGIREGGIEYYSSIRTLEAIRRSRVTLLVFDASSGVLKDDKRIAGYILKEKRACILVANKWDMVGKTEGEKLRQVKSAFQKHVQEELHFLSYCPLLLASALRKIGIEEIPKRVLQVDAEYSRRIETHPLNEVISDAQFKRPPPTYRGKNLKIRFCIQGGIRPPTFVFKVNSPDLVHFSYRRYLENRLRESFGFCGSPVEMLFKKQEK